MADLLKWHHATVTTCHSKTKDLPAVVSTLKIIDFFPVNTVSVLLQVTKLPYKVFV